MLQGGPLPCFMDETLLDKLLDANSDSNEAETQFRDGLAKFGLIEVSLIHFVDFSARLDYLC